LAEHGESDDVYNGAPNIFWDRYTRLRETTGREQRIATGRELDDVLRLRDAAEAEWLMRSELPGDLRPPSALKITNELSRAPVTLVVTFRREDQDATKTERRFTIKSRFGRRFSSVTDKEANRAAAIYVRHSDDFRQREDGGRYATYVLYTRDRDPEPGILSRPMVGHLIVAIENGWLPWDSAEACLVISDDFRTSPGMFTIPRLELPQ
jgi:hypothetical protein